MALWALSAVLMLSVLYGPYEVESSHRLATRGEAAMYNGWSRTSWSIGLGYIILSCCMGQGGKKLRLYFLAIVWPIRHLINKVWKSNISVIGQKLVH